VLLSLPKKVEGVRKAKYRGRFEGRLKRLLLHDVMVDVICSSRKVRYDSRIRYSLLLVIPEITRELAKLGRKTRRLRRVGFVQKVLLYDVTVDVICTSTWVIRVALTILKPQGQILLQNPFDNTLVVDMLL
jgi:hypothetical protein